MLKELIALANKLDSIGLVKEADALDETIKQYLPSGKIRNMSVPGLGAEYMEGLRDTQSWIAENLYYSSPDSKSKFPIKTDVDLSFGFYDNRYMNKPVYPPRPIIVPKGTVFESMEKPVSTSTGEINLRMLIQHLEMIIAKAT